MPHMIQLKEVCKFYQVGDDRVRALETLHGLLENSGDSGAEDLYRALEDAAGQLEGSWDDD